MSGRIRPQKARVEGVGDFFHVFPEGLRSSPAGMPPERAGTGKIPGDALAGQALLPEAVGDFRQPHGNMLVSHQDA